MRIGSLFDGIGGFPLAASRYGIIPVWASEIETFPVKVTQKHFPDMRHLGDITQINGAEIDPVDVITFGSPCQDLSVAGKRVGLEGERSGLFAEAIRIIKEMRGATDEQYPRFAVWENVPGAFSSNGGQDFRAVLSEIAEAEIPMPASGKWAEAGMVRTERIDVAWRTLDAQYWGVPQRRKRIFLVADFRGQCAGEILFIEQGLSGDSQESGEAREEVAATAGDGIRVAGFKSEQSAQARGIGWQEEIAPTLPAEGATPCICLNNQGGRINCTPEGITGAVSSKWAKGTGGPAGDECYNLIIEPRSPDGVCRVHDNGIAPTLNTAQGGQRQPCVCIQNATRGKSQNGLGVSQDDTSYTLDSLGNHAVVAPTVDANINAKWGSNQWVDQRGEFMSTYAVRRLTPLECSRLQGFPDSWLDIEGASDTAKYKAIGNSVAIVCVDFIMAGIAEVLLCG